MTNCANEPGGLGSILSEARFVFFFLILFLFFLFASFFSGIFFSLLASFPFWPLAPAT